MTQADWRIAVTREIHSDVWYEQPEQNENQAVTQILDMNTVTASENGNSPKVTVAVVNGDV